MCVLRDEEKRRPFQFEYHGENVEWKEERATENSVLRFPLVLREFLTKFVQNESDSQVELLLDKTFFVNVPLTTTFD